MRQKKLHCKRLPEEKSIIGVFESYVRFKFASNINTIIARFRDYKHFNKNNKVFFTYFIYMNFTKSILQGVLVQSL